MAKSKASERLRAPLMYAFRSAAAAGDANEKLDIRTEDGERVIASRRATATRRRSLSDNELKRLMSSDLEALLNTTNLESAAPELLEDLKYVKESILNFGMPDMANKTVDETMRIDAIRHDLRRAILQYEPRLLPKTLEIVRDTEGEDDLSIKFVVRSDMRADPVPTSVEFVTEVELQSGDIKIQN